MIDNSHFNAMILAALLCGAFAVFWKYGGRITVPVKSKIRNFFYYSFFSRFSRPAGGSGQVSNSVSNTVTPPYPPQQGWPTGGYPTSAAHPQQPPWQPQVPSWGAQDTGWGTIERGGGNYVPSTPLPPPPPIPTAGPVRTPPPVRHTPDSLGGNDSQMTKIAQWMADPIRADLKRVTLIETAMERFTVSESTAVRAYRESRRIVRGRP